MSCFELLSSKRRQQAQPRKPMNIKAEITEYVDVTKFSSKLRLGEP